MPILFLWNGCIYSANNPVNTWYIPSKLSTRLYNFVKIVIFPFSFRLIDLY